MTADVGVCDSMVLCRLLVENAVLRGDSLIDVQRQLEMIWLEFAYAAGSEVEEL
jgi:hypothetical protein